MGAANADRIMALFDEMKRMDESDIRDTLTKVTVKTWLFKRRMVHVARRFGALRKGGDLGRVTLQKLMKSFEGTAIYDEALKETFTKDLNLESMIRVLKDIGKSEIEVSKLETKGVATPVARVGIERVSMKTDLIPPERMKLILVESARARLLNEVRTFVCTNCWEYLEMIRMKDLPEKPVCPRCGSSSLGALGREEERVQSLVDKRGEKLTKVEEKMKEWAVKTARLMSGYGKPAAVALSGRKLKISDVKGILKEEKVLSNQFFELVMEAERNALKRRFW
jgi:ATP-dependent Lhr-like helicase